MTATRTVTPKCATCGNTQFHIESDDSDVLTCVACVIDQNTKLRAESEERFYGCVEGIDEHAVQRIASKIHLLGPDDRPPEELAPYLQVAGMCWCTTATSGHTMDSHLAEAFARVLRLCLEELGK